MKTTTQLMPGDVVEVEDCTTAPRGVHMLVSLTDTLGGSSAQTWLCLEDDDDPVRGPGSINDWDVNDFEYRNIATMSDGAVRSVETADKFKDRDLRRSALQVIASMVRAQL